MNAFEPTRTLLNPKFEGYKLDPVSQDEIVARFPLQYKPTQATVSGKSPLSFQEVQSRITHNHLAICTEASRAMYVDSVYRVILIDIDPATISPSFRVLYELPTFLQSDETSYPHREYPSGAFVTPSSAVVSDGQGLLYALNFANDDHAEALGTFSLPSPGPPFRIHTVHILSSTAIFAILSSRYYGPIPYTGTESKGAVFDIWGVRIELTSSPLSGVQQLEVLWHRRGQDVPIYTAFIESLDASVLISGTTYQQVGEDLTSVYEPSAEELAPIPRADEKFDIDVPEPSKPPPYSWTQTSDSVTMAIPLPSNTPKSTIKVMFSPQSLTVHVDNEVCSSVPIPRYSTKKLWDMVSTSTSYWTWDREAEHSFGLLTLYLDKQHAGTKWTHVFAPTQGDMEVLETLDPSQLWHIREALEKYTAALRDGDDASGLGLGRGVPSLAEGELDMEVDETVGRKAYLSWVNEKGVAPLWCKNAEKIPYQLLSTPFTGSRDTDLSLVVKNNLDGTVHTLDSKNPNYPAWTHTSTFSALSFVLASKQDTRFTFHSSEGVFAFEGGIRDRGGNVYIYRVPTSKAKWAKQAILKVGDGYGGPLLGVGIIHIDGFIPVILCLAEGELILLKNP
ncbi:hypothetical protein C0992_006732 [Termitomyces sp. T32_za158]|nr:hypothetical protein C0992_006732 [Termitomyces sp. T32_za158]